jgi:hypothetical protein
MKRRAIAFFAFLGLMTFLVWFVVTNFEPANVIHPDGAPDIVTGAEGPRPALPPLGHLSCGGQCGRERWLVKTLSDADRDRVDLRPVDATIEQLIRIRAPRSVTQVNRSAPAELTVFRVNALLVRLTGQHDNDYHLVLVSPTDPSASLIAEIPDPSCSGSCASGFGEVFARERQQVIDVTNATGGRTSWPVRVTGVGFFDREHGQIGVAPNGIELHPVLSIEFLP